MSIENIVEDWDTVKKRWQAWWNCEIYDRVLVSIHAPRSKPRDDMPPQNDLSVDAKTQWTDTDYMIRRTLEAVRTTYYGGEAIPWCWNPISAGHALYFGGKPHFTETVWVDPAPVGDDGYPVLDRWRNSCWWSLVKKQIGDFAKASKGRFFVLPFWGNHAGDILAVVRGVQRFYMDFAANPEWVRLAVKTMSDILMEVHEELWKLAYSEVTGLEGSLNYNGCWSPIKSMSFDCDISCNVSPKAFEKLLLPPLIESMRMVDHRIYHLDGPGAIPHLDSLLDIPELHAIQWVPGYGNAGIMQWIPLIRRIQEKGKGIQVHCSPEEIEALLEHVKPEGLHISTGCRTEDEARDLPRLMQRLS